MAEHESSVEVSASLPPEVITCLQNARFLHLATCADNIPHVSLMNYTYLPSSPYTSTPAIIMTTPPSSRKTTNLLNNPLVSLLVHDWVSHRPQTLTTPGTLSSSPPHSGGQSSLASLLLAMNTASLSRISATINGHAKLIEQGSPEEAWLKARHLENNTFGPSEPNESSLSGFSNAVGGIFQPGAGSEELIDGGDGGKRCFIEGEEVRVVVVTIRDVRTADWKGDVKDWAIAPVAELTNGF